MSSSSKQPPPPFQPKPEWPLLSQGAEARIYKIPNYLPSQHAIVKERFRKTYRHVVLDERLTKARCKAESKALIRARRGGVPTPAVWGVQLPCLLYLEFLEGPTLRQYLEGLVAASADNDGDGNDKRKALATEMGTMIGKLHNTGLIHGDLTTSNMIYVASAVMHLIDFGLAKVTQNPEELAVDLYVLERALISTHPELEEKGFFDDVLAAYKATGTKSDAVLQRLSAVRLRGRKRECFG